MISLAVATLYDHIIVNSDGVPVIKGTTVKVVEIVMDVKAHGWSPEEIHWQHPHLSLAQIHSALAYYWDNRDAMEQDIAERSTFVESMREELRPFSLRPLLKEKGVI